MVGQRQDHGRGQMIGPAQHHCGAALGELGESSVGVGRLRVVDDNESEVFAGRLADDLAVAVEQELLIA